MTHPNVRSPPLDEPEEAATTPPARSWLFVASWSSHWLKSSSHQSSQLLQRRNTVAYPAATPTCRTTRTLVIDSTRDRDTGHSTSTGHPLPPSRRTRIDHFGRSTWIKLEGTGTFHDTPYCCRECPASRFGRFAFAANFTPIPANSSSVT